MSSRWSIAALAVFSLLMAGGGTSVSAKDYVTLEGAYAPGTIVVVNSERKLYCVLGEGRAIVYPVAVGKPRDQWTGKSIVTRMRKNPGWSPTPTMRRRNPRLPRYMPPGPKNPLGVRAIYLGWTAYRIHGTNSPTSIGRPVSSGCFRMLNDHVVDLFERVHIGAPVYVVNRIDAVVGQQ